MLSHAVTRRRFLIIGSAAAAGVAALDAFPLLASPRSPGRPVAWVSPRGALDVVDDYPLWVATELGYFESQGVDLGIEPGVIQPDSGLGDVLSGSVDVGFPAPNVLVSSVDRGLPLRSFFQLCAGPMFGFALGPGTAIRSPRELSGTTIAVGSASWAELLEPLLVEAGVDPRSVRIVEAGEEWLKAVSSGRADAALAWRGIESSASAKGLRFLLGERYSTLPANSYVARAVDLADDRSRRFLTAFSTAVVMALEFTRVNPVAAAQIVYRRAPGLSEKTSPARVIQAVSRVAEVYEAGRRRGLPWGIHERKRWTGFLRIQEELGRVKQLRPEDVYSNALIAAANSIDTARVKRDALGFRSSWEFRVPLN